MRTILIWMMAFLPTTLFGNVVFPSDTPTIEALIDAHKQIQNAELRALTELEAIQQTHSLTEKVAAAYNNTRTILNKRLSDGMSYLSLALQLANLAVKMERLIENYQDFTTTTYSYALKKPYIMAYYTRAQLKLAKEIKHLSSMIGSYAAANFNILKATMEEKFHILGLIEISISNMNRIIIHNDLVCRTVIRNGLKLYHIQELFGNETQELLTQKIIARWDKNREQ